MRILHISNPINPARLLEVEYLTQAGYTVDSTTSVEEADSMWMEIGELSSFPYDIVIADHDVNVKDDGIEWLAHLREKCGIDDVLLVLYTQRSEAKIEHNLADLRIEYISRKNPHLLPSKLKALVPEMQVA